MDTPQFPEDGAQVLFTDMQGIQRKGVYKKGRNGYEEKSEVEVAEDNQQIYPEEEITKWEYIDERQ
jgi:hypothetical protein